MSFFFFFFWVFSIPEVSEESKLKCVLGEAENL